MFKIDCSLCKLYIKHIKDLPPLKEDYVLVKCRTLQPEDDFNVSLGRLTRRQCCRVRPPDSTKEI
jgi:hypothetical protein